MGRIIRAFSARGRSTRGQAMIEMAMTFPLVIVVILVVVELGFAFNAYTTVIAAARNGARAGAVYLFNANADPTNWDNTLALNKDNRESGTGITPPYLDNVRDTVAARVSTIRVGSSYFDKNTDVNITYKPTGLVPMDTGSGDLIQVTVVYHYRPITGFFGNWTINMRSESTERME